MRKNKNKRRTARKAKITAMLKKHPDIPAQAANLMLGFAIAAVLNGKCITIEFEGDQESEAGNEPG